jgi:hypothetical protein
LPASGARAKIIDYSNCHLYEIKLDSNSNLRILAVIENNIVVKVSADPEANDKIIKLKWSKENFDAYNTYSDPDNPFFVDGDYGWLRLYKGLPGAYENYIKRYKTIKKLDKYSFSINIENSTITRIYTYSDDWFKKVEKSPVDSRLTRSIVYKIESYADEIIIGKRKTNFENRAGQVGSEFEVIINLKDSTFKENYYTSENYKTKLVHDWPKVICNNISSKAGLGSKNYLDYWWALVLIAGIIFFIYTQTGKEFNIQNQFKIEKILKLFTYLKFKKVEKKNKTNKKDSSKKEDFKDYLG